jgi:hypothetical protein
MTLEEMKEYLDKENSVLYHILGSSLMQRTSLYGKTDLTAKDILNFRGYVQDQSSKLGYFMNQLQLQLKEKNNE